MESINREDSQTNDCQDEQNQGSNFQFYFKFNIAKVTSETQYPNHQRLNEGSTSNNWFKNINSIQQNDTENRFFVFGLFFLNNTHSKDMNRKSSIGNPNCQPSSSNRLVFFLFNCVPDNIKHTIIKTQSSTYLIRKPLFSSQKICHKNSSQSTNNAPLFSDTYRFYYSKNANDVRLHSTDNSSNLINPNSQTPNRIIKKSFSISDILRYNLVFNKLSDYDNDPQFFLNYIDYIEESCAKSYIKSVIHYLGNFSNKKNNYKILIY